MKRPPKELNILGQMVAVQQLSAKRMPRALGHWYQAKRRIHMRSGMLPLDTVDTLLHEISHAILSHQARPYGKEVEENYVNAIAAGLAQVLRDNPELRRWIEESFSS